MRNNKGQFNHFWGKKHTQESKEKMSNALKGKKAWNKGISWSEETKRKISLSKKGNSKPNSGSFKKGITPWIKGKKHSEEVRKRMSKNSAHNRYWLGKERPDMSEKMKGRSPSEETRKKMALVKIGKPNLALKGRPNFKLRGSKNKFWKGGITPLYQKIRTSLEYKLWREAVFKRDNYTCVWCGDNQGGNLNADHIKPFAYFPELRLAIDNGRTLCHPCHKKTDTWGNKAKNYEKLS